MERIKFFGNTDVGQSRSNNEDAFVAQNIWDNKHILAVVIDGVGGYDGGEIASAIAQKSIVQYLKRYPNGERLELLRQAVIDANNTIFSERSKSKQYSHMCCVLTAILVDTENGQIHMAHVGDTRLYQYANGTLVKLSHDHSLIGYREEIGELTEEEAMRHPQRNVIGRDVGSALLVGDGGNHIEAETFPLIPNSLLMLCSDGLCDMLTSEQMRVELRKDVPITKKVELLIRAANKAGGKDNITVVVVEYGNSNRVVPPKKITIKEDNTQPLKSHTATTASKKSKKAPSAKTSKSALLVGAIIILLVLIGYILGGWNSHSNSHREFLESQKHNDSIVIEIEDENKVLQETLETKKVEQPTTTPNINTTE